MAIDLTAVRRDEVGKGAARRTRSQGLVPAIIYGDKTEPVKIALDPRQIWKQLHTGRFFSTLYKVNIEGGKAEEIIVRDVQFHPVSDAILHADFFRASDKKDVTVDVPVVFLNQEQCPGLKRGGVLNVVRYKVAVECKPKNIPDQIEVDLSSFQMGVSVHINDANVPDNIEFAIKRNFTIATVAIPRGMTTAEASSEEGMGVEEAQPEAES